MIKDSFFARLILQLIILALSSIAPISVIYFLLYFLTPHAHLTIHYEPLSNLSLQTIVQTYFGAELLFYVYFLFAKEKMQRPSTYVPLESRERAELFVKCVDEVEDFVGFIEGHFMMDEYVPLKEIYRGNVEDW
jgi:hypothetical protein